MEKHLVFFDVDGTLMHHHDTVYECDVAALKKLKAAGHEIFLNTGRSRSILPKDLLKKVKFDGFVCGSSYVEYHGKVLHRECVDDETLRGFCRYAKDNGIKLLLEGEAQSYGVNQGCFHPCVDITEALEDCLIDPGFMRVTKLTADRDIPKRVYDRFPRIRCINFGGYSEQIVAGYDKAYGMKLLCDKLGVPYKNTAAFGDSVNDIEMLKFAGKSVIMKQAAEKLDEFATFRATVDEGGVCEGIEKLFFGEEK
ncbi:MAG: HAD family phosphatase [Clostridia bacterium]|nr:HAD family phosphatase [Clostridia bacterium]